MSEPAADQEYVETTFTAYETESGDLYTETQFPDGSILITHEGPDPE